MEHDIEPTEADLAIEPMLQLFKYKHLSDPLMRSTSRRFCELAWFVVAELPRNPERTASLRKLREAKDTAITAMIWKH